MKAAATDTISISSPYDMIWAWCPVLIVIGQSYVSNSGIGFAELE
jgi:hypothetical protein